MLSKAFFPRETCDLWIGTTNGVSRFSDAKFTVYLMTDGLSKANVLGLYTDDGDNLWAGTAAGLSRSDGKRFMGYDGFKEDAGVSVYALHGSLRAGLWISTSRACSSWAITS